MKPDLYHKLDKDEGSEQQYCSCSDTSRPRVLKNFEYCNFNINFWRRYGRSMTTDTRTTNLTIFMGYLTNINITKLLYVWLVFTCFLPNTVTVSGSAARDTKSMQGNEYQKVMEPDQRFYKRMRYSDWTRRFLLPNSKDRNANSFNKHIVAKRYQEIAEKFPHLQQYHKVLSNPTKSSFGANFDRGSTEITGMWAVKLKIGPENNSRDRLDQAAERIAMQHGLENHGQIGELKGYYLFTKKDVSKTWTTMASAVVQEGGRRSDSVTAPTLNDRQTDSYQTPETTLYTTTETWTSAVSLTPTESTVKTTMTPTISLQDGELEPGLASRLFEPTPSWNVEQGLSKHNQVEWQGHQVLLTRSKRELVRPKLASDSDAELHNKATVTMQEQKTRTSTLVTTIHEDYHNITKNDTVNAGVFKLFKTTAPSLKHAKPSSSSRPFLSAEERARHEFYEKYMSHNSHSVTLTPQQVEVTHNQHYKDMVGGSASGGGIGGRRMGIGDDEEESAGDWWSLNLANTMRSEENNGKKEFTSKFQDPLYGRQWHLKNHVSNSDTGDCNVTGVWDHGITGKGVVVAVVDDGVQWDHPDLIQNYCPEGSFDLNANDDDPMPVRDSKEENKHGTRCAGEIAAAPNNHCGVGVAYGARFSGIRILDGPLTDSMEAAAFNKHLDINDIYSCSWGPEDDGKTVDGPHPLAQAALKHGVVAGRRGFGSIYIVASGNGGHKGDNCNYDGYANSIYTITIGAVDEFGRVPSYAEECASMLACTFSSGAGTEDGNVRKIVTTDWTLGKNKKRTGGCTESHTGTSAATPLAAGMVALMLEARPCLTWRDVQHIIVMTAIKIKPDSEEWTTNTAGFHHSDKRGFGLLSAWRMVNAARVWRSVPWLTSLNFECPDRRRIIPNVKKRALIVKTLVSEEQCQNNLVFSLEQVLVTVDIEHPRRGDIFITLVCPSGTTSVIGGPRKNDDSSNGLWNWTFATVKCWGEHPYGTYRLIIHDTKDRPKLMAGELRRWKLTLYGSTLTKEDIMKQQERVEKAMNGEHLSPYNAQTYPPQGNVSSNESAPEAATLITTQIGYCPPFEQNSYDNLSLLEKPPTERTLKMIGLSGIIFLLWAIYCAIDMGGLIRRGTHSEGQQRIVTIVNNPMKNINLPLKSQCSDNMNLLDSVHKHETFTDNYPATWWNNFNMWMTRKLKHRNGDIDIHDASINFSKETKYLLSTTQETT